MKKILALMLLDTGALALTAPTALAKPLKRKRSKTKPNITPTSRPSRQPT